MISRLQTFRRRVAQALVVLLVIGGEFRDDIFNVADELQLQSAKPVIQSHGPNPGPQTATKTLPPALSATSQSQIRIEHVELKVLLIIVFISIYFFLEEATEMSFDNSRWVRRLVMGDGDIEGEWIAIIQRSDVIQFSAYINIIYRKGDYRINITQYDPTMKKISDITSTMVVYREDELHFKWEAVNRTGKKDNPNPEGHGVYKFKEANHTQRGSPKRFTGNYFEDRDTRRYYIDGEKVEEFVGKDEERRRLWEADQDRALAKIYLQQYIAETTIASGPPTPSEPV